MDRSVKAFDTVTVYATWNRGQPLARFEQQPYSLHGMDNFEYKGVMYKGYQSGSETYILLNQPLKEK